MKGFGKAVVRSRIVILILAVLLLIPSAISFLHTRVNYDILTYLPKDIETMKGQKILAEDFGTGAFSLVVVEGLSDKEVVAIKQKIEKVDHVKSVLWYDSLLDITIPEKMLPEKIYNVFRNGDATLMAVIYDTTMSEDETLNAIVKIREVTEKQVYISGMSALVEDTKELSDKEIPVYVCIAVILSIIVLSLTMDSFLIPLFFLLSIGFAIIYNLGSNFIQGEISYVTQALAAVLQLAVTMDYSIFLWHSYTAAKQNHSDRKEAMAEAINETLSSVVGSSVTTVAGFVALMFMSFTLGRDLGFVMAKGVVIGVFVCVTVLPSLILVFDKAITKTSHRALLPSFDKVGRWIVKHSWIGIVLFLALIGPAIYGYKNTKVYYNLDIALPQTMDCIVANNKLLEKFDMNSTHMILYDSNMKLQTAEKMIRDVENVDGVKTVLGIDSITGPMFPETMIPDNIRSILDNGEYKMLLIMSEYKLATDEVNAQCDKIKEIVKSYDEKGMLIGEAPCTEDLIRITDKDFTRVNTVSIGLVLLIIIFVFLSGSLPVLLVCVIEFAIFINMGIPYYTGTVLPFIASIVIGTIQLGSTVDYAILMTNKYKGNRLQGMDRNEAVSVALSQSMSSIIVSAMSFFAATIGVGLYSKIDMIGSLCTLMGRGALISMFVVILLLPAVLKLADGLIIRTTGGMRHLAKKQ